MKLRRLFVDIETSPNIGVFWRPGYNLTLNADNIIKERAIICAGWKWQGQSRIEMAAWDKKQNDEGVVKALADALHRCDEVVAHNGDRFDIRWIRGRALKHGIEVNPFVTTVDTLKIARKYFELNSHRLDYLGKYLGLGGKIDTNKMGGLDLWKRIVIDRDEKALEDMMRYNRRDVQLLEAVYHKLEPYFPAKSRLSGDMRACPSCGSRALIIRAHRMSAAGRKTVQLSCNECGKWCTVPASKLD